jgi:hypothetical protein
MPGWRRGRSLAAGAYVRALRRGGRAVAARRGGDDAGRRLLFGAWIGTALAVVGATIGACALFLAARSALAPLVAGRAAGLLDRIARAWSATASSTCSRCG